MDDLSPDVRSQLREMLVTTSQFYRPNPAHCRWHRNAFRALRLEYLQIWEICFVRTPSNGRFFRYLEF